MNSFITPITKLPIKRHAVLHPIYDYTVISSYHVLKLNGTSPKYDVLRACCSLLYKTIYLIKPNLINIPAPVRYDLFDTCNKLKMKYYFIGLVLSILIHFTFNYYLVTLIYVLNRFTLYKNKSFGFNFTGLILFYLYILDIVRLMFF